MQGANLHVVQGASLSCKGQGARGSVCFTIAVLQIKPELSLHSKTMPTTCKRRKREADCDVGGYHPQLEHDLPDPLTVDVDTSDSESGYTVYFYGESCSSPEHFIDDSGTDVD